MAITPKPKAKSPEQFIESAPDAPGEMPGGKTLRTKRGINRSQVSVVLADDLVRRVDEQAAAHYMSRSAFITMALTKFLAGG